MYIGKALVCNIKQTEKKLLDPYYAQNLIYPKAYTFQIFRENSVVAPADRQTNNIQTKAKLNGMS